MRPFFLLLALLCFARPLFAQKVVYTINADSTKLTGCDSNELIIENHTQNIPGFLFNTGRGRTIFKRGVVKLNDSSYIIGGDTLKSNAWLQGGNSFGALGILGTLDNNSFDLYTNNAQRMRFTNTGRLLVGTTTDNNRETLQLNGSMYASSYISNFLAPSGSTSGALRLRWGSGDGSYISFYKQGSVTKRGFIESPSDAGQLVFEDSIGITFKATPIVSVGTAGGFNNAKFTVLNPFGSTLDVFNAGRYRPSDTTAVQELTVKNGGNVIVGPGADQGYKLQVVGSSRISFNPNLSRSTDHILIGGAINTGDGQNILISTAKTTGGFNQILVERDGNVGLGIGGVGNWIVGSPPLRILSSGAVDVMNQIFYFGLPSGPNNTSALIMTVSNTNEWTSGAGYPTGQNYYTFGSVLSSPTGSNKRAPLRLVADQLQFMTGAYADSQRAVITEAGNLGIGTTSPSTQLHTTGGVRFAGLTQDSTQTRVIVSDASGNLYFRSAASLAANDILRSSLAVNGTITAKELRLTRQGWADYVFDSTYRLMSLPQLQEYVRRYRHLPDVPSAAEVARDGISVGETQTALLKKIEELTIYTIEQDKKISELSKKVDLLMKNIQSIEKKP